MRLYFLVFIFCLSFSAEAQDKTLLVLGDSISAGYGLSPDQGWVHLLQKRLRHLGYRYTVINASISGDTTRGARARLGNILSLHQPDVSIIELGGNDGLRGLSLEEISVNLEMIINNLVEINSCVLLVPMRLPPNYGQVYNDRFAAVFDELAEKRDIVLTEFILQDIADKPDLMQSDGIHPLAEAQELMLDLIWLSLQPNLQKD
ncbi:MAG: arylesterase [Gammaproteobacteria bacterium]|jgi:acyl-CoA thioesterase I|nr:arylesterase [Gammaproteobacteria bacterium]